MRLLFIIFVLLFAACGEVAPTDYSSSSGEGLSSSRNYSSSGGGSSSSVNYSSSISLPDLAFQNAGYYMISDLISLQLYDAVMNGKNTQHTYPATATWFDAMEFCERYSAIKGRVYLPTEEQWEYAALEGIINRNDFYWEWTREDCYDNDYPQTINCNGDYRIRKGLTNPPESRFSTNPNNLEDLPIGFRVVK